MHSLFPLSSLSLAPIRLGPTSSVFLRRVLNSVIAFVIVGCAFSVFGSAELMGAAAAASPAVKDSTAKPMKTYVIMRRSGWDSPADLSKAAARSSEVGQQEMSDRVKWIRSYVTDEGAGRVGTVCVYQAVDEASLREHARRANLPCDTIVAVGDTVVVNPDPAKAM